MAAAAAVWRQRRCCGKGGAAAKAVLRQRRCCGKGGAAVKAARRQRVGSAVAARWQRGGRASAAWRQRGGRSARAAHHLRLLARRDARGPVNAVAHLPLEIGAVDGVPASERDALT